MIYGQISRREEEPSCSKLKDQDDKLRNESEYELLCSLLFLIKRG